MDLGIAGERALILGGTQGLGYSCAKFLHQAGVKVVLNGRDAAKGEAAARALGAGAAFVGGDLSKPADRARLHAEAVQALGDISILVTNAGGPPPGQFMEQPHATWLAAIETNVLAAIEIARLCLPAMLKAGFGRIVNITSFVVREPYPNMALSNAVRVALTGAMAALAREVADKGVTVNNILPGLMDTPALQRVYGAQAQRENISIPEAKARMAKSIPLQRLGAADDFGPLCAFVCSRHANYITAQNFTVDGGLVRGLL